MIRDYYKVEGKSYISSEYSEKKFRSVQTGQTMNDVLKIMGEPVGAATSGKWNVWCYALQGVSEPHVRRIIYFKNGRVEEILIMGKVGK